MVERSGLLYDSFPQFIDWDKFALKCPKRNSLRRVRAYPGGIDWTGRITRSDSYPDIRTGIHGQINVDANSKLTLAVSWDPMISSSTIEVAEAARELQKYYEMIHQPRMAGKLPAIPEKLAQKKKGGRPQLGSAKRAIAVECARLKDDEMLSYVQIAKKFNFSVEKDSYDKPTQSSKARRYVKLGRQLRNQYKS
jgi:hypothetical protein